MLRSLTDLEGYKVAATDGEVGKVVNFMLDDENWTVRALVVRTSLFEGRRVLISPMSFQFADWDTQRFHVALTVDKVAGSPGIDVDKPVSRQHEREYYGYYGYTPYWGYAGAWGMGFSPGLLGLGSANSVVKGNSDGSASDVHLRSVNELRGYHIEGTDKPIGHVEDFVVDDQTWQVRYLVIDTSNWWLGKKVLVAPSWAREVDWTTRQMHLGLTRDAIKRSPEYKAEAPVNREYEARLFDYYGRPAYWENDAERMASDAVATPRTGELRR